MGNKQNWVKFYFMSWASDTFVSSLSAERKGVYFTLLVRQMVEGYVPLSNPELLLAFFPGLRTPEEVAALIDEGIRSKFVLRDPQEPNKPVQWINVRCAEAMRETEDSVRVPRSGEKAYFRSPSTISTKPLEDYPEQEFDFDGILAEYPPRPIKNDGFEEGKRLLMDSILDQESFDDFCQAVRAYKRERAGGERTYNMKLVNFAKKWRAYVPTKKPVKQQVLPEKKSPSTDKAKDSKTAPPWTPGPYASEQEKARLAAMWTEDRKRRWEAGEEIPMEEMISGASI